MNKILDKIFGWCYPLFKNWQFPDTLASYLSLLINIIILCFLAYGIYIAFRYTLVRLLEIIAKKQRLSLMIY